MKKKKRLSADGFTLKGGVLDEMSTPASLTEQMDVTPELKAKIIAAVDPVQDKIAPSIAFHELNDDGSATGIFQVVPCTFSDSEISYSERVPDPAIDIQAILDDYRNAAYTERRFDCTNPGDMSGYMEMVANASLRGAMILPNDGVNFEYIEPKKYPVDETRMK